jgi:hypothetical protein
LLKPLPLAGRTLEAEFLKAPSDNRLTISEINFNPHFLWYKNCGSVFIVNDWGGREKKLLKKGELFS